MVVSCESMYTAEPCSPIWCHRWGIFRCCCLKVSICTVIDWCDQSRGSWYLADWMLMEPCQSRELSKRLFIGPAGSWTEVSPMGGTLHPGRHTGGQSRVSALAFWWSSGWHQQQVGLSSGIEGDHTHTHIYTHTLPHSCWGANGGWQGGLLLKSCRCLEMAFKWMGALIGVVWRLSLHAEHRVILFCWFLINKQCLKATMHLEGQHSDSLVASMLFVFESYSNSHWGDHISWEVLTSFINCFPSLLEKKTLLDLPECQGLQLWYSVCQLFSQTEHLIVCKLVKKNMSNNWNHLCRGLVLYADWALYYTFYWWMVSQHSNQESAY